MADKNYRDDKTGQWTTAADAAARPAETVAETAPTRRAPLNEPVNHHIGIDASDPDCAPRLVLVCTATPGSDCRKRPTDDREAWQPDDPDLIDGECWAAEWVSAAGWDDSVRPDALSDAPWPHIPVIVHYDEGVIVAPIPPRRETPDVAELRRLAEACPKPGSDPHILGPWWDASDLARIPVDVPADREFIMAASPAAALALLDRLAHMTEARDNARAEVGRLTALLAEAEEPHPDRPSCTTVGGKGVRVTATDLEAGESESVVIDDDYWKPTWKRRDPARCGHCGQTTEGA